MKTDHFGPGLLNDLAHGIAEWRDVKTPRRLRLDSQFAAIGRKPITPGLLASAVERGGAMTEEIGVDWLLRRATQFRGRLRGEVRLHCCTSDRAQSAGLADRGNELDCS
jgi:hypothetical protein